MTRKRRFSVGCLSIILVIFAYRFIFVYRWTGGDCATGPQPRVVSQRYPKHLLVMTYNIEGHAGLLKGNHHLEEIAKVINDVKPDIVGLNEVHRHTWQSRFHDQVAILRQLTHMNGAFGAGYVELGGAFGNAVLTRGDILRVSKHNLPAAGEPRSLLSTIVRIDGVTIEFFVTHVAAWGGLTSATRAKQLECAASHVRNSRYPHILTGDFNASPKASEIEAFRRTNTTLQLCGEDIGPTQRIMKERLDYIFADRGWQVRSARVLEVGPSDHRPVIAELVHE